MKFEKIIKYMILILILSFTLKAFVMDDCKVGRVVYIDDWHDEKVVIKRCDYSDNTIKVKDSDGDTKWVKPSELMGEFGKFVEDQAEDILLEGLENILKGIVKGKNHNNNGDYYIYLENRCSKSIKFALDYKTIHGSWKTDGWWEMKSGESAYLSDNGGKLTSNNSIAYFYAETLDEKTVWEGNDNTTYLDGKKLYMKKKLDSTGSLDFILTCSN